MPKEKLTLAYSPCPNDTFIFGAWATGLLGDSGYAPEISLLDIAQLNEAAQEGRYDVVKVSVAAYPLFKDQYSILPAGGAFGKRIGPILVRRKDAAPHPPANERILIPGKHTTARLLLRTFYPECHNTECCLFSDIMPRLQAGEASYGVVIHEGRFTYAEYGLDLVKDFGLSWDEKYSLPIPLGVICARREFPKEKLEGIADCIRQSLSISSGALSSVEAYIRAHAQEMDSKVLAQHIEAYVNEYSMDFGDEGQEAIARLLAGSA